jgi:hypothetical protein
MQIQISKDVDLIVEADDAGKLSVECTPLGEIHAYLETKCCTCSQVLSADFNLGRYLTVEPEWQSAPVYCSECQIRQLKKIRYHIQARKEGLCE